MKITSVRLTSLFNLIFFLSAMGLVMACFSARIPNLFNGLWEDEILHNEPLLAFSRLSAVRRAADSDMKPMLDFTLRKLVFGKSHGIPRNERNLQMYSLIIGMGHLLLLLFVPWTESRLARFAAASVVGFSWMEALWATEAQYYALTSFMGTALCLMALRSFRQLDVGKDTRSIGVLATGIFLSANTNFFNAALIIGVGLMFLIYLVFAPPGRLPKWKSATIFLGVSIAIAIATYYINEPAITYMRTQGKVSTPVTPSLSWSQIKVYMQWTWILIDVSFVPFLLLCVFSLFHPRKNLRFLAFTLFMIVWLLKFVFVAYTNLTSTRLLIDRYTIMFLGPAAMEIGLGLDSILLWVQNIFSALSLKINEKWQSAARPVAFGLCLILLIFAKPEAIWPLSVVREAPAHWRLLRDHPANYSVNFEFFDHVKQLDGPVLILTSYCWGTPIPSFYMNQRFGRDQKPPIVQIYETAGCQHSPAEARQAIDSFFAQYRNNGYVVFFYELTGSKSGGCGKPWKPFFIQPGEGECLAIYKAKEVGFISEHGNEIN